MKTIYSFQEFYDDVMALAMQKGKDYVCIRVTLTTNQRLEFSCYIAGYDFYSGATPQEAIEKLRNKMFPPDPDKNKVDIEVEMPNIAHAEESAHIED